MMSYQALNQYKSVDLSASVQTATPHQLIAMLFRGALEALAKAKGAVERRDIENRTKQINKSTEIIINLKGMLDHEKGGEVAGNLDQLYDYMVRQLMLANRENSIEKIDEVARLISEIATGWSEIPPEQTR